MRNISTLHLDCFAEINETGAHREFPEIVIHGCVNRIRALRCLEKRTKYVTS